MTMQGNIKRTGKKTSFMEKVVTILKKEKEIKKTILVIIDQSA